MIRWTSRHPLVPVALVGIVLCLGSTAVWRMPVDYLLRDRPQPLWAFFTVSHPPGREEVLERIVRPFEKRALAEPGITGTSCRIWPGGASVEIVLERGEDPAERAGRLREVAAAVCRSGPAVTRSVVWRSPPQQQWPGLLVQLSGVLRDVVEEELLPRLRRLEGVRSVRLYPDPVHSMRLELVDPEPGTAAAVEGAVARAGHQTVLGRWAGRQIVGRDPPRSLDALLACTVAVGGTVGPLGELALAVGRPSARRFTYRVNGQGGLFLVVHDDPELERRSVLSAAAAEVQRWSEGRPGVAATVVGNRWQEVTAALHGLAGAALTGMLLALACLALALGRARAALVLASSVPLSLALTVILLAVVGRGLDILTVGTLALALGLLVDAAVVVGEAVAARRSDPVAGVRDASRPIIIGGVTTIVALSPLWLGVTDGLEMLEDAVLPLACAIAASVVVAVTVVPGLVVTAGRISGLRRYSVIGGWVKAGVRDPLVVGGLTLAPSLLLLVWLGPKLDGGDRLDQGDPRDLEVRVEQPVGSDPERFSATVETIERRLAGLEGVDHVTAWIDENQAWLRMRLDRGWATGTRRRQVVGGAYDELQGGSRNVALRWQVGAGRHQRPIASGSDEEVELGRLGVSVVGDDPRRLAAAAERVYAAAAQHGNVAQQTRRQVVAEARLPGVDPAAALVERRASPVELILDGRPVQVEVHSGAGSSEDDDPPPLAEWLAAPTSGGVVPSRVVTVRQVEEPEWPPRRDGVFETRLELQVARKTMTLEDVRAERERLHERLRRLPLPPGVSVTVDPLQPERERTPWLIPVVVAVGCLVVALGIGFDSLLSPIRVVAVLVPHLAGAVLVLWLLRIAVNEAVVLGGLLLLGVAVNSGVLLEDRFRVLRAVGARQRAAAVRAGVERSPAVLLTAATSILAVLPLWLGGVDQLGRPFVAVLGGGLLLGTPATIALVPALQSLGAPRRRRRAIAWKGDGSDVVDLRSLSRSYGAVRAVRHVTTSLSPGLVGLLGPNGAGKTTLIRIVVGALGAHTGDVWVNGVRRGDDPGGWRALVGYLPQDQAVPLTMEAGAWLRLWGAELCLDDPGRAATLALETMGVSDLEPRRLGELSGGQRRRVRVARALLGEPPILVVDEPTTGLDPEAKVGLRNLLSELARHRVVLLSTHIPEDVAAACSRVLVLAGGRLVLDGSVDDLLEGARGKVRQRLVDDAELRHVARAHRLVSRVRSMDGIRVRYLTDDDRDPGEVVPPTLEEAYLWLVRGRGRG